MKRDDRTQGRRDILRGIGALGALPLVAACDRAHDAPRAATTTPLPPESPPPAPATPRTLGRTGVAVEAVSLGGEGILRTTGQAAQAVPMIQAAFAAGVKYCDTAPAYASSQDYYGAAFRASPGARDKLFLASKTHDRTKVGALALLDDSLKRLGTDHLDLWQMHDLRSTDDVDRILAVDGAVRAAEQAKKDGRVRFIGVTGHHDPGVLVLALQRFPFDAVLLPINAADPSKAPFHTTVIPEARKIGAAVIGMKVLAHGMLVADGVMTAEEAIRYAMGLCDTMIIGCSSAAEIEGNLAIGRRAAALDAPARATVESRIAAAASKYVYYKG
jgi:aryl-alcohol dehydrogenase-like predicted oxidoreductase